MSYKVVIETMNSKTKVDFSEKDKQIVIQIGLNRCTKQAISYK